MTSERTADAAAAFDPALPSQARRHLTARRARPGRHRTGLLLAFVVYLATISSVPRNATGLATLIMLIAGVALIAHRPLAQAAAAAATARARCRHRDRFIDAADLDQPSQQLLRRAQEAITFVLASEVHKSGQLDDAANVTVLAAHEWDIARLLRDTSRLRAEHGRLCVPAATTAPAVDAVARPQQDILRQVQAAVTARVETLECYAYRVHAADAAYRNWQQALALTGLNDSFLDLLARTAADDLATAEITDLAEQASIAEQAFRGTLCDARTAASPVVLSAPQAQPGPAASAA